MRIEDLRYGLVPENLEGTPREIRYGRRDLARLLVIDRKSGKRSHSVVRDLPKWLTAGDVVVLNNSKRIPGVLRGRTTRGGQVELRFVDLDGESSGLCRIFPMHDVRAGAHIRLDHGGSVLVTELNLTKYNLARVSAQNPSLRRLLIEQGEPILGFFYEDKWGTEHLNPYYATEEGTVESPLAGLHFTPELVEDLENAGVEICFVTLHSVGSWLPFLEERVEQHEMWAENFRVSEEACDKVRRARSLGRRIVACGSTSLRALESAAAPGRTVRPATGRTSLYITPGYSFRVVDAYFTNFHQHQTSLIVLDAAFCGDKLLMRAYREASRRRYSFYEFGDAVLYI